MTAKISGLMTLNNDTKLNLNTKVPDFVQFGGLECTVGGTVLEMWLGAL